MKRTYRSLWQTNILIAASIVIPLVMAAEALLVYTTESWTFRLTVVVLAAGMAWFGIFRLARIRVSVDLRGVEVFNPFRRAFVSWDRISGFSLRTRALIFGPLGHIDLKDGSAVVMFAIAGQNPALRPSERSAARMIEELNRLLRQVQAREPFHESDAARARCVIPERTHPFVPMTWKRGEVILTTLRRLDAAPRRTLHLPQTCRTVPRSQRLGELLPELLASNGGSPLGDVVGCRAEPGRVPPGAAADLACMLKRVPKPDGKPIKPHVARMPDRPHAKQSVRSGCGPTTARRSKPRSVPRSRPTAAAR